MHHKVSDAELLLNDVQLTLENEKYWYLWCTSYHDVRTVGIGRFRNAMKYYYLPAVNVCLSDAQYLLQYFIWRYTTNQKSSAPMNQYELNRLSSPPDPYRFQKAYGDLVQTFASIHKDIRRLADPRPNPPESIHMTKLSFKQQFLLNGADISCLSDADIFSVIAAEEKRIEKLKEIKNQPKKLKDEISAAEANLKALVDHLDSK